MSDWVPAPAYGIKPDNEVDADPGAGRSGSDVKQALQRQSREANSDGRPAVRGPKLRPTAGRADNGRRGGPDDRDERYPAGISQIDAWQAIEQSVRAVVAHLQAWRLRFVRIGIMAGMRRRMLPGTLMWFVGCGGVSSRRVVAMGSGGFQKAGVCDP